MVLSLLLAIASRQRHESIRDIDVYRFPRILVRALQVGVVCFPILGFLVYRSFERSLEWYEIGFLLLLFGTMSIIIALQLWVVARYSLEARIGRLVVKDWRGSREIRVEQIRKVVIAYPWRGRGYIDLFSLEGTKMERVDGGLQDFEELADFIVNQCAAGTVIRERSPGQKWIERVI